MFQLGTIRLILISSHKDLQIPYGSEFAASISFRFDNVDRPWDNEVAYDMELRPLYTGSGGIGDPVVIGSVRYAVSFLVDEESNQPMTNEHKLYEAAKLVWPYAHVEFVNMARAYGLSDTVVPPESGLKPPSDEAPSSTSEKRS